MTAASLLEALKVMAAGGEVSDERDVLVTAEWLIQKLTAALERFVTEASVHQRVSVSTIRLKYGLTNLEVDATGHSTLPPRPPVTPLNPDCEQNKHRACTGDAWNEQTDEPTTCGCRCHWKEGLA
jgi:hypothetical protein